MLFHCTLNRTILVLFIYYKRLLSKIPVFKLFQLLSLERMVRVLYIITECRFETMESHVQISCKIGQSQLLSHFPYSQCTELTNHSNMLYCIDSYKHTTQKFREQSAMRTTRSQLTYFKSIQRAKNYIQWASHETITTVGAMYGPSHRSVNNIYR